MRMRVLVCSATSTGVYAYTNSLGQSGHLDMGNTSSSPLRMSRSRNPGNHSSMRASTLSTTAHSSLGERRGCGRGGGA